MCVRVHNWAGKHGVHLRTACSEHVSGRAEQPLPTRLTESMLMVRDNYQTLFEVPTFTSTNNDYRYQACFAKRTWTKSVTLCVKLYDKDGQFNGYLKVSTSTGANIPEGL